MAAETEIQVNIFPAVHVSFEASTSAKDTYGTLVLHPNTNHVIVKGMFTNPSKLTKPSAEFQNQVSSASKHLDMLSHFFMECCNILSRRWKSSRNLTKVLYDVIFHGCLCDVYCIPNCAIVKY
jgi:hypothetical protein